MAGRSRTVTAAAKEEKLEWDSVQCRTPTELCSRIAEQKTCPPPPTRSSRVDASKFFVVVPFNLEQDVFPIAGNAS